MDTQVLPSASTKMPTAPVAGACLILFVATLVGGWLYVDSMRNELESRIQALEAHQPSAPVPPASASDAGDLVKEGWYLYRNAQLGFSVRIPETHTVAEGGDHILIIQKPTPTNETPVPDMIIRQTPAAAAARYPGTMIQRGDKVYWLYTWENFSWDPSEEIIASFKTL